MMCEEILRERIKKVFEREIDRVEQISRDNPLKDNVRLIFVVEEYKEILREILDEDDGRMQ
jgi:formate dehydrogenase maturation protein FdhE